jgi:hypothetical protein
MNWARKTLFGLSIFAIFLLGIYVLTGYKFVILAETGLVIIMFGFAAMIAVSFTGNWN